MKNETKVMYTSDEAAQQKTVTGWFSRDGRYWGKDEAMARFAGCTHKLCECGNEVSKSYIRCETCRAKADRDRYNAYEFKKYNGNPVYSETYDKFFFSEDEIQCFIEDELEEDEAKNVNLRLVFCEEIHFSEVDISLWEDEMYEDQEDLPKAMSEKLDELNKLISELPANSYRPSKIRTEYQTTETI